MFIYYCIPSRHFHCFKLSADDYNNTHPKYIWVGQRRYVCVFGVVRARTGCRTGRVLEPDDSSADQEEPNLQPAPERSWTPACNAVPCRTYLHRTTHFNMHPNELEGLLNRFAWRVMLQNTPCNDGVKIDIKSRSYFRKKKKWNIILKFYIGLKQNAFLELHYYCIHACQ